MKTVQRRFSAFVVALVMVLSLFTVGAVAWTGGEGIDVYWNDEKVGTVTYDDINAKIQTYEEETYSSHKNGEYKDYTGKVFYLNKFLGKVNKAEDWASAPAETTFDLYDPDYADKGAKLTKAELDETRNYYDKSGNLVTAVNPGFMLADGKDYFQFVYGQKTVGENTNGNFAKFTSSKNAVLKINTPATPAPTPSENEEKGDGIDVYWNDKKVGSVNYDQMIDDVSKATSTVKYSAVNGKGNRVDDIEGYVYKFSQLMKAVEKDKDWENASIKTKVEIAYGEDKKELTKSELYEDRYYFDESGTKVNRVNAGFMDLGRGTDNRYFQLVYGQKTANEKNKSNFFSFKRNVITTIKIDTPELAIEGPDGQSEELFFADLEQLWQQEGAKKYNYSSINTHPTFRTEEYYGPTLKTVLSQADINLDALSDTDVIRFGSGDGRYGDISVKNIKATRYSFPNGKSKNNFTGTTEAQLTDKVEVPFIISVTNGKNNIRDIFGQIDPQEQNRSYYIHEVDKITVLKDAAEEYKDWTPTIADGGKYYEGAKLNFDLVLPEGVYDGFVYYTSSTNGTAPADPTHSDILYNFAQNQEDGKDYLNPKKAEFYNSYVFTDAEKTIIKVKTYIFGCSEPQATTLTYTLCKDHVAAAPVKENEKEATCTAEGSYDEVVYCSECHKELSRETKKVAALGHTEVAIGEAKEATCTEPGMTAGKKCSVCGEVLEAQKEISALGHDFKDGKCTRCGAEDPDYKPEPTPVDPDTKFTGLANSADKDGVWWYYTDGKIDTNHTGVDQNKYGWWRVENGKVNFKAQGIYQNAYGWWKTTDGEVTFKENSIYQNEFGWWKCKDSKVDFSAQSIYQNQYGWWKTTNGKVNFKENGLFKNQYGTWKVENSKVNFNFNGKYQGKTIKNGKVV